MMFFHQLFCFIMFSFSWTLQVQCHERPSYGIIIIDLLSQFKYTIIPLNLLKRNSWQIVLFYLFINLECQITFKLLCFDFLLKNSKIYKIYKNESLLITYQLNWIQSHNVLYSPAAWFINHKSIIILSFISLFCFYIVFRLYLGFYLQNLYYSTKIISIKI